MSHIKTDHVRSSKGAPVRQRVMAAAERLLHNGKASFSMRDLAAEAGVSFATPFNQFGSKAALMHALSELRIDAMAEQFSKTTKLLSTVDSVLLAIDIAVAVMLEEPSVNRAVMGWMGTADTSPGNALERSAALWAMALGTGEGLPEMAREKALRLLPHQLALAFRGALSFWTAGEIPDDALGVSARAIATTLLLGVAACADN